MKSLTEKYQQLVVDLQVSQAAFPALTARLGSAVEAQRHLDNLGVKIVAFEREHGIDEARHILAHETVTDDLPMFERLLRENSQPVDWATEVAAGRVGRDEVEGKIAARAQIVAEAKKSITTLTRVRKDASDRRKKIPAEVIIIAREKDPLSGEERLGFERYFLETRGQHVASTQLQKILQPV